MRVLRKQLVYDFTVRNSPSNERLHQNQLAEQLGRASSKDGGIKLLQMQTAQNRLRLLRSIRARANSDNGDQTFVRVHLDEALLQTLGLTVEALPIVALLDVQLYKLFGGEELGLFAELLSLLLKMSTSQFRPYSFLFPFIILSFGYLLVSISAHSQLHLIHATSSEPRK